MSKKSLVAFLLSFLILFGIFASSVNAETETIEPPVLLTIDDVPVTTAIPEITNTTPTLVGECNLPFAIMEYEMRPSSISGVGYTDRRGIWKWIVPQQLSYGLHTLYVTATDPNDSTNTETSVFRIEVTRNGTSIAKLGLPWLLGAAALVIAEFIGLKRLKDLKRLQRLPRED